MTTKTSPSDAHALATSNAERDGIDHDWSGTNEQWWDWYMSLAYEDAAAPEQRVPASPLPVVEPADAAELEVELAQPYPLGAGAIERFRQQGFIKLKDVMSAPAILALRAELTAVLAPMRAVAMRFPSAELMWTKHPVSRAFTLSPRLGGIAAALLGVPAVRLYHDNALNKLPGCGRTPWHYDAHHYPIASEAVVTLWLPLQSTPRAMGPLAFARDMDAWKLVADLPFAKGDDSYDRGIASALREAAVPIEAGPFALGEASFHHTRCLHTAGPNQTDGDRMAFATTYLADGARVVDRPTLVSGDYQKFMPGVGPGDPIASSLNPLIEAPEER